MKFPFVTRAWHEAEIAEEKHAAGFQRIRRNYWKTRYKLVFSEAERLERKILELQENLRGVISQRDMASKNYQKLMEDYHDALHEISDLETRLAPFERMRGPNGKFVSAQPKGETP